MHKHRQNQTDLGTTGERSLIHSLIEMSLSIFNAIGCFRENISREIVNLYAKLTVQKFYLLLI